nr:hypothetical protein Iba_chr03cCG1860 [Ipomoea batatas]
MARGRVSHFQQRDREFVGGSSKVTATCRGNVSAAIFPNKNEACRSSSPEKCQATFIRDDGDRATVEAAATATCRSTCPTSSSTVGGVKSDNGGQRLEKIYPQVFPFQSLRVSLVIPLRCSNDGGGCSMSSDDSEGPNKGGAECQNNGRKPKRINS